MSILPLPSQTLANLQLLAAAGQCDAQALLHLLDRADKRDQDVAVFVDSYSSTIAALCHRLDALERGANDLPAPAAPEPVEPESEKCETCDGEGTIDETLGGWSDDNPAATCPDCDGVGEPRRFHRQAPAAPVDAGPVANALLRAEAALADVAEGEAVSPRADQCLHWAEARCTEALAAIRPVMQQHGIRTSEWPAAAPASARAGSIDSLIPMVLIPSGSFLMGSPEHEPDRSSTEGPQHQVTLGSFFMAQTPITQAQWREVASWPKINLDLKLDPSHFKGDQLPVEQVSWFDVMEFCHRLSQRTGKNYTLPSEAQWEYACRAGTTTPFYFGPTISTEAANYDGNHNYGNSKKGISRKQTTRVATFPANPWGLYDMHGNVWEWCLDQWHNNYKGSPADGSAWEDDRLGESPDGCCAAGRGATLPGSGARLSATATTRAAASAASVSASVASPDICRLLRGGSWFSDPRVWRSAFRLSLHPDGCFSSIGFRVCYLPQD